nr:hypothetical protein [Tanacetum cinerariifolium]
MEIQNQSELGEGSTMPTDPHHTPTILQSSSSSQPQKTQKPKKPKRKDTQVPQPSGPIESVADEAVHKELGDSLVRAATTASSLKAEQDSGNITKTQSKATPNEPSYQGTTSGGGPRCQETMRDTIAQTRVEFSTDEEILGEDASKHGRRIDAINADEDITLVNYADNEMFDVDDLGGEEVFVAWKNENVVEEVVNAAQVSTAAKIVAITTEEITLAQALEALKISKPKMKGIVFQEPRPPPEVVPWELGSLGVALDWVLVMLPLSCSAFKLEALAERLQAQEQEQEQEELSDAEKTALFQQLLEKRRKHFVAKRAEEKRNKPPTEAQQRKIMCTYLKNMEGYKLKDLKLKEFDSIQDMF